MSNSKLKEKNGIENKSDENQEREISEATLKKILNDLYPTSINKNKYIQENPSLKLSALSKGILKSTKKEKIDSFLIKQVPKTPKAMKQLTVDWLENKKSLKIDVQKLNSDKLKVSDVKGIIDEGVSTDDFETYCLLIQPDVNPDVFKFIEKIKKEELEKKKASGEVDSEKVKQLESEIKSLTAKLEDERKLSKSSIDNLKQNYEIEKEKNKSKQEQKIETFKGKYEEEKSQLIKIQADSDVRFSEERKKLTKRIDELEKTDKKLKERVDTLKNDLANQSKQNKDRNKELARLHNRSEDELSENRDLSSKNEELKHKIEQLNSTIESAKQQEVLLKQKNKELTIKINELEKIKIALLLNESEVQEVIRGLNSVDEDKQRMFQLLNIDTRRNKVNNNFIDKLDELWVELINHEEDIMADYVSVGSKEIKKKDALKDKIDNLLDLQYNLKAREVLVKMLYEKGYKAYQSDNI